MSDQEIGTVKLTYLLTTNKTTRSMDWTVFGHLTTEEAVTESWKDAMWYAAVNVQATEEEFISLSAKGEDGKTIKEWDSLHVRYSKRGRIRRMA